MNSVVALIKKEVANALQTAGLVVRRGIVNSLGSDFFGQLGGFGDEQFDDIEIWQQYGLASRPPVGSEAVAVKPGNTPDGAIIVATTNRSHRPDDLDGDEVVLHGASGGQAQVRMKADGDVRILTGGDSKVLLNKTGDVEIEADGEITANKNLIDDEGLTVKGDIGSPYDSTALTLTNTNLPASGSQPGTVGQIPDTFTNPSNRWIKVYINDKTYVLAAWEV